MLKFGVRTVGLNNDCLNGIKCKELEMIQMIVKAPSELCECMVYDGVYLNWFTGGWSPELLFSSSVESKQYGVKKTKT
jgi:hypothetical protein